MLECSRLPPAWEFAGLSENGMAGMAGPPCPPAGRPRDDGRPQLARGGARPGQLRPAQQLALRARPWPRDAPVRARARERDFSGLLQELTPEGGGLGTAPGADSPRRLRKMFHRLRHEVTTGEGDATVDNADQSGAGTRPPPEVSDEGSALEPACLRAVGKLLLPSGEVISHGRGHIPVGRGTRYRNLSPGATPQDNLHHPTGGEPNGQRGHWPGSLRDSFVTLPRRLRWTFHSLRHEVTTGGLPTGEVIALSGEGLGTVT